MTQLPISLVVITLNEEKNIQRCLDSVPWVSEKIVVDSFSSDNTVELAQKCGAKVIQEKWRGFGPQKSLAVSATSNDWVISLDADEALSPELQNEILEKFNTFKAEAGYLIPRKSFHLGRWINYGGWYPDYQLRLFNKKYSNWDQSELHEKINSTLKIKLKNDILHWVFKDISHQVVTNDRYSSLGAEKLFHKGEKFCFFKLLVKPPVKFIECYLWKLGFLDGLPGFIIAVGAAYSIFLRYAKIWEMENLK